jgi:hypothetical protein
VLPPDELPRPDAEQTARNIADRRAKGRPFEKGNKAAAGRRPKLALLGVKCDVADPKYRQCLQLAANYRRRRVSELTATFGYVSSGASAMISSSALALAASKFVYMLAAKSSDPALLKQASALATDHRQNDMAAFELASREGAGRRTNETAIERYRREMDAIGSELPKAKTAPSPPPALDASASDAAEPPAASAELATRPAVDSAADALRREVLGAP